MSRPTKIIYFQDVVKPVATKGVVINRDLTKGNTGPVRSFSVPGYTLDPISSRFSEIGTEYNPLTTQVTNGKGCRWQHKGQVPNDVTINVLEPVERVKKSEDHVCDNMFYRVYLDSPDVKSVGNKNKFSNLPSKY